MLNKEESAVEMNQIIN